MTDNGIIKALECCKTNNAFDCNYCPYEGIGNEMVGCVNRLIGDALDLINRQKAELDDLKRDDLPRCKDALRRANEIGMRLDKENQELKAEIEKLRNAKVIFETVDYCAGDLEDALKEVGRLKIENESLRMAANSFKLHYNTARAEAIKEFADKLQEYLADHNAVSASYLSEFVKKLAKELTEGDSNAEITE